VTYAQAVGFVAAYLSGALAPETRLAVEAHLQGCDHCTAMLNTYQQTVTAVRSLRCADLPEEMEMRVHDFLVNRMRGSGDDGWPHSGPAHPFFNRLMARLRRLARAAEPGRMMLVPLAVVWVL
jgi:anti-sigma factor RsiW